MRGYETQLAVVTLVELWVERGPDVNTLEGRERSSNSDLARPQ